MVELYIVRHGIAIPHGTPGLADDDRPLTPKGEERIRQIGRGLVALKLEVEQIVTSPLIRARGTAQMVAEELGMVDRLEVSSALGADSSAEAIRDWLRERNEARLMIVGHNPSLSDLVGLLTVGEVGKLPVDLKKGGIAALSTSTRLSPRFSLCWIATPALLRRIEVRRGA
jgi:phosphohistidine phosphatase